MVKFAVRDDGQGKYYLPKEVREELGKELSLICNAKAAVIFNKETSLELVLESLSLITKEIEHRFQLQERTN